MTKVNFDVSDSLLKAVDENIKRWGFHSRAEFFRFAAVDFIRNDARYMPADKVLAVHAKTIRSVKARRSKGWTGI